MSSTNSPLPNVGDTEDTHDEIQRDPTLGRDLRHELIDMDRDSNLGHDSPEIPDRDTNAQAEETIQQATSPLAANTSFKQLSPVLDIEATIEEITMHMPQVANKEDAENYIASYDETDHARILLDIIDDLCKDKKKQTRMIQNLIAEIDEGERFSKILQEELEERSEEHATLQEEHESLLEDHKELRETHQDLIASFTEMEEKTNELMEELEDGKRNAEIKKTPTATNSNSSSNSSQPFLQLPTYLTLDKNNVLEHIRNKNSTLPKRRTYQTSKTVKATERQNLVYKIYANTKMKVENLKDLKLYLRNVGHTADKMGFTSISDICKQADRLEGTAMVDHWTAGWSLNTDSDTTKGPSMQFESNLLFDLLERQFGWNTVLKEQLLLIEEDDTIPNDLRGVLSLLEVVKKFGNTTLREVITQTVNLLMFASMNAYKFTSLEAFHLTYKRALKEYETAYGNINHNIIYLANIMQAIQIIGNYETMMHLQQLTMPRQLNEILMNAEEIAKSLTEACETWDQDMLGGKTSGYRKPKILRKARTQREAVYLALGIENDQDQGAMTLHTDSGDRNCGYCGDNRHTRATCQHKELDKKLQRSVGHLTPAVAALVNAIKRLTDKIQEKREVTGKDTNALLEMLRDTKSKLWPLVIAGEKVKDKARAQDQSTSWKPPPKKQRDDKKPRDDKQPVKKEENNTYNFRATTRTNTTRPKQVRLSTTSRSSTPTRGPQLGNHHTQRRSLTPRKYGKREGILKQTRRSYNATTLSIKPSTIAKASHYSAFHTNRINFEIDDDDEEEDQHNATFFAMSHPAIMLHIENDEEASEEEEDLAETAHEEGNAIRLLTTDEELTLEDLPQHVPDDENQHAFDNLEDLNDEDTKPYEETLLPLPVTLSEPINEQLRQVHEAGRTLGLSIEEQNMLITAITRNEIVMPEGNGLSNDDPELVKLGIMSAPPDKTTISIPEHILKMLPTLKDTKVTKHQWDSAFVMRSNSTSPGYVLANPSHTSCFYATIIQNIFLDAGEIGSAISYPLTSPYHSLETEAYALKKTAIERMERLYFGYNSDASNTLIQNKMIEDFVTKTKPGPFNNYLSYWKKKTTHANPFDFALSFETIQHMEGKLLIVYRIESDGYLHADTFHTKLEAYDAKHYPTHDPLKMNQKYPPNKQIHILLHDKHYYNIIMPSSPLWELCDKRKVSPKVPAKTKHGAIHLPQNICEVQQQMRESYEDAIMKAPRKDSELLTTPPLKDDNNSAEIQNDEDDIYKDLPDLVCSDSEYECDSSASEADYEDENDLLQGIEVLTNRITQRDQKLNIDKPKEICEMVMAQTMGQDDNGKDETHHIDTPMPKPMISPFQSSEEPEKASTKLTTRKPTKTDIHNLFPCEYVLKTKGAPDNATYWNVDIPYEDESDNGEIVKRWLVYDICDTCFKKNGTYALPHLSKLTPRDAATGQLLKLLLTVWGYDYTVKDKNGKSYKCHPVNHTVRELVEIMKAIDVRNGYNVHSTIEELMQAIENKKASTANTSIATPRDTNIKVYPEKCALPTCDNILDDMTLGKKQFFCTLKHAIEGGHVDTNIYPKKNIKPKFEWIDNKCVTLSTPTTPPTSLSPMMTSVSEEEEEVLLEMLLDRSTTSDKEEETLLALLLDTHSTIQEQNSNVPNEGEHRLEELDKETAHEINLLIQLREALDLPRQLRSTELQLGEIGTKMGIDLTNEQTLHFTRRALEDGIDTLESLWKALANQPNKTDKLEKAIARRNYENFHNLPVHSSTDHQVKKSSAGVEGWKSYRSVEWEQAPYSTTELLHESIDKGNEMKELLEESEIRYSNLYEKWSHLKYDAEKETIKRIEKEITMIIQALKSVSYSETCGCLIDIECI